MSTCAFFCVFVFHCATFTLAVTYYTLLRRLRGDDETDAKWNDLSAWSSSAVLQWWLHNIWVLLLVKPVLAFKTHAVLSSMRSITLPFCVHLRFICCACWSSIKYLKAALKCSSSDGIYETAKSSLSARWAGVREHVVGMRVLNDSLPGFSLVSCMSMVCFEIENVLKKQ